MSLEDLQNRYNKTYRSQEICICNKTLSDDQGDLLEELLCTNAMESGDACGRDNDVSPVQKGTCYERHNRKKRSARHHITYLPDNFVTNNIVKRAKVKLNKQLHDCLPFFTLKRTLLVKIIVSHISLSWPLSLQPLF